MTNQVNAPDGGGMGLPDKSVKVPKSEGTRPITYKETAKSLGVRHLFGRWGISFYSTLPGEGKYWHFKLVPLDGWTFDPKEITEAFANDPDFSIKYKEK